MRGGRADSDLLGSDGSRGDSTLCPWLWGGGGGRVVAQDLTPGLDAQPVFSPNGDMLKEQRHIELTSAAQTKQEEANTCPSNHRENFIPL